MGRRITTSSGRLYVQQKDKKSVLNREIEDEGYYKLEQDQMYDRNHKLMETVKHLILLKLIITLIFYLSIKNTFFIFLLNI
jgi:hypothetical protein